MQVVATFCSDLRLSFITMKNIFEFADRFGYESPFGDWVTEEREKREEREKVRAEFVNKKYNKYYVDHVLIRFDILGTWNKIGQILVDYTFDFENKKSSLWIKGDKYQEDKSGLKPNEVKIISQFKQIFDSLIIKSKIFSDCYTEMLVKRETFEIKDIRKNPIRIYPKEGKQDIGGILFYFYSAYRNKKEGINAIEISTLAAPVLLYSKNNPNGKIDDNPDIINDVFHEFMHAYDDYLDVTSGEEEFFSVKLTKESAVIIESDSWYNTVQQLRTREEYSVFMENKFRKEQKLPLRLSYPIEDITDWENPRYIDVFLLEDGHIRKYFDKYDYDK